LFAAAALIVMPFSFLIGVLMMLFVGWRYWRYFRR